MPTLRTHAGIGEVSLRLSKATGECPRGGFRKRADHLTSSETGITDVVMTSHNRQTVVRNIKESMSPLRAWVYWRN